MFRSKFFGLALAPVLCSSVLLGAAPSQAYLENTPVAAQALATQQQASALWQTFRSDTDGFRISMPSQPIQYVMPESVGQGQLFMQMQLVSPQQLELYGVAAVQLPQQLTNSQDVNQMMSACARLKSEGDQVTNVQEIPIRNHPGVEVETLSAKGRVRVSRCYLVGQRFYMLFTEAEPIKQMPTFQPTNSVKGGRERTQTMNQFLNSFQLFEQI